MTKTTRPKDLRPVKEPTMPLTALSRRQALLALTLAFAVSLVSLPAFAQNLDAFRASGALGERWDGFVEVRNPAEAGAQAAAKKVNAERKKIYEKQAQKTGASLQEVGQIYAQQILKKAPKGTPFLNKNGQWTTK